MIETYIRSFTSEIFKIAASKAARQADAFHMASVKDWDAFEKDLKSRRFQSAMLRHDETDKKLKKYVKNFGDSLSSKRIIATIPSRTEDGKTYKVKVLPSGRMSCACKDWQYHHSVRNSDCDHIKATRKLFKTGLIKSAMLKVLIRGVNLKRRADMAQSSLKRGRAAIYGEES